MTTSCPGCHGAGTEPSGTTHAGLAEHLACGECGPGCPPDCGCRVDAEPECPESVAQDGLGADSRLCRLLADKAALLGDVDRLTAERDRARGTAVALEAENARLRDGIERLASMLDTPAHRRPPKAPRFLNEAAPLIERDAKAAALEEASGQCEADASDWYGIFADIDDGDLVAIRLAMQERGKDIDNVSAHMFRRALHARARILRDRAQAIREG